MRGVRVEEAGKQRARYDVTGIAIAPWKVTRDETSDGTSDSTSDFETGLDILYLICATKGIYCSRRTSESSQRNVRIAQATVGGGDFFIQLLIVPLILREPFTSLCRSTSTCVGALKLPLRRLIFG